MIVAHDDTDTTGMLTAVSRVTSALLQGHEAFEHDIGASWALEFHSVGLGGGGYAAVSRAGAAVSGSVALYARASVDDKVFGGAWSPCFHAAIEGSSLLFGLLVTGTDDAAAGFLVESAFLVLAVDSCADSDSASFGAI